MQGEGGRAVCVDGDVAQGPCFGGFGEYEAGGLGVVEAYGFLGLEEGEEGAGDKGLWRCWRVGWL